MKIRSSAVLVAWCTMLLSHMGGAAENEPRGKTTEEIPIKIDVGFGFSEYTLKDAYDDGDADITGTELSISAVVKREIIRKYQDRIPKRFRKRATKLEELSVEYLYVPKTLYIAPDDGKRSAFGATWGFVPNLQMGFKYLEFGISAGIVATYLFYHDNDLDDTVHFIRPGLRGGLNLSVPMFDNNFSVEAGINRDIYLPQQFFGDENVSQFSGSYFMIQFRFPTTIEAEL